MPQRRSVSMTSRIAWCRERRHVVQRAASSATVRRDPRMPPSRGPGSDDTRVQSPKVEPEVVLGARVTRRCHHCSPEARAPQVAPTTSPEPAACTDALRLFEGHRALAVDPRQKVQVSRRACAASSALAIRTQGLTGSADRPNRRRQLRQRRPQHLVVYSERHRRSKLENVREIVELLPNRRFGRFLPNMF